MGKVTTRMPMLTTISNIRFVATRTTSQRKPLENMSQLGCISSTLTGRFPFREGDDIADVDTAQTALEKLGGGEPGAPVVHRDHDLLDPGAARAAPARPARGPSSRSGRRAVARGAT